MDGDVIAHPAVSAAYVAWHQADIAWRGRMTLANALKRDHARLQFFIAVGAAVTGLDPSVAVPTDVGDMLRQVRQGG